ncbi:unnamed protein product, partial [Iphiclides podalirius]
MYTTWYSRGESGMHHHQMGQLYHHGPPMIKTEAGVNSDCMMAVDYAPPIKPVMNGVVSFTGRRSKVNRQAADCSRSRYVSVFLRPHQTRAGGSGRVAARVVRLASAVPNRGRSCAKKELLRAGCLVFCMSSSGPEAGHGPHRVSNLRIEMSDSAAVALRPRRIGSAFCKSNVKRSAIQPY